MSSWKGQTRGGVTGYKIFVWTLRYLGLSFAYFLLCFVVTWFIFTSGKAFGSLYRYFRNIHHYGKFRSFISIYRNYYIFGQVLIDKLALLTGFQNRFTFDFEGEEHLREMKNGGLLVSAHVGNWEIAGQLLNRLEKRINILLMDAEHQQIKQYLSGVLTNRNVNFIVIREDFSHLAEIQKAFSMGEIIAMHGDRFIEGNKVMVFDFLGQPAPFPVGPVNIASRFGVPVSYVYAIKETNSHYHFYATPLRRVPFSRNLEKRDEFLREALEAFVRSFEVIVRKYPLHWFNYYDFWNPEISSVRNKLPGGK